MCLKQSPDHATAKMLTTQFAVRLGAGFSVYLTLEASSDRFSPAKIVGEIVLRSFESVRLLCMQCLLQMTALLTWPGGKVTLEVRPNLLTLGDSRFRTYSGVLQQFPTRLLMSNRHGNFPLKVSAKNHCAVPISKL